MKEAGASALRISPAMRAVIAHFEGLGPRWGLRRETCAAHVLLYLAGRPMRAAEVAQGLGLDAAATATAIDDLVGWRMARRTAAGFVIAGGEPWDLLFSALEERRRRELAPALDALTRAAEAAGRDGTPPDTSRRIRGLLDLVRDLAAIGGRVDLLSSRTLTRLVSLGGRAARIFGPTRS
jgi:DNA-binding transcriptional regulator GbsR (MarR family)